MLLKELLTTFTSYVRQRFDIGNLISFSTLQDRIARSCSEGQQLDQVLSAVHG
jgi:hypothetical protein